MESLPLSYKKSHWESTVPKSHCNQCWLLGNKRNGNSESKGSFMLKTSVIMSDPWVSWYSNHSSSCLRIQNSPTLSLCQRNSSSGICFQDIQASNLPLDYTPCTQQIVPVVGTEPCRWNGHTLTPITIPQIFAFTVNKCSALIRHFSYRELLLKVPKQIICK